MSTELVYEIPWILNTVSRKVSSVSHIITRTDKLEELIYKDISQYLSEYPDFRNNVRRITFLIDRKIVLAKKNYRIEEAKHYDYYSPKDENRKKEEFDPPDTLASVESGLEIKETIDLLAKDDRKKRFVLSEWANGNFNDSEISGMLAHTFGGNAASHRIFIQRFRTFCQRELATAI